MQRPVSGPVIIGDVGDRISADCRGLLLQFFNHVFAFLAAFGVDRDIAEQFIGLGNLLHVKDVVFGRFWGMIVEGGFFGGDLVVAATGEEK